jgi:hypothetical protein
VFIEWFVCQHFILSYHFHESLVVFLEVVNVNFDAKLYLVVVVFQYCVCGAAFRNIRSVHWYQFELAVHCVVHHSKRDLRFFVAKHEYALE